MTRPYECPASVGGAYDGWTADGVLERYWGEHIHHGFYPEGRFRRVDFRKAKEDLIERLLAWSKVRAPTRILDVGSGIGGSSRYLARRFGAEVVGITLSEAQVARAKALTAPELPVRFEQADAQQLPFEDGRFDLVWSCESGEHMPDKPIFFEEMVRVLAPGGVLLLATWCRRQNSPAFSRAEEARLMRIYREWALPPFVTLESYREQAEDDGRLVDIETEDWSRYASPTWSHQIWLGLWDLPWLLRQPRRIFWRSLRDAWAVRDMIAGYRAGTIRYGVLRATRAYSS